ncbi:uncharacterized protein LOC121729413 isoform X2 [Aricia agestis]|uniref:uncharacterized protein LOC121729413 isoform X2 n=1 Tax=Aricia agestis TaxID=91739 RepID=UPI001C206EAC|nr:uncharacterized protein LOC121729413 isoform X2 [Aricia agestis]
MHMWMWFGFDLGEFLFSGLYVTTRWAFALTWIALFVVALLFEGSKVYLARVQRDAYRMLRPFRSDERRNLLCEREQQTVRATNSRTGSPMPVTRWASFRIRTLVNTHQTAVFTLHNAVGYLLMLCVMLYNVHLILAVVLGMMLGYFLFGTQLTLLRMQCVGRRRVVVCTPECDDTENSTPPLLNSTQALDSDIFACQTRTCIQPSHYFRASTSQDDGSQSCQYGAKACPSKVARAKNLQSSCHKEGPSVEDSTLLQPERGCCKEPPPERTPKPKCCKSSQVNTTILVHESEGQGRNEEERLETREESPQISCCNKLSDSQEQIVHVD